MEDRWRRWIAKCLLMEHSEQSIVEKLTAVGYTQEQIGRELNEAAAHPYLQSAREVFSREMAQP